MIVFALGAGGADTGVIVGSVIGGVIGALLLAFCLVLLGIVIYMTWKKKRSAQLQFKFSASTGAHVTSEDANGRGGGSEMNTSDKQVLVLSSDLDNS